MAVWYDILIHLRDYLKTHTALTGVTIKTGALDPGGMIKEITNSGVICLVRDRETREKLIKGGEGVVDILAFCYARSDNPDPTDGYTKISALEDNLVKAVTDWLYATKAGLGADIIYGEVEETVGDLDSQRPLIGSRKTISIQWSKRTL